MLQPKAKPADVTLSRVCVNCPVCRRARKKQKGIAFWLTRKVEGRFCPFCRAFERVHGRKSHEPLMPTSNPDLKRKLAK